MSQEFVEILRKDGVIHTPAATLEPITGGISSDVFLLSQDGRKSVVKRALARLRVKDDWFASPTRNRVEQDYLNYVRTFAPHAAPAVIASYPQHGYFVMEYLGDQFRTWKQHLLAGDCQLVHAQAAGDLIGTIHLHSFGDAHAADLFATDANFFDLRIESYLLTTAGRNPEVRAIIETEAARLQNTHEALVHGDYSPKNMLVSDGRFVIVDCETAWFGDPAFDLAFVSNHLLLKALYHAPRDVGLRRLVDSLWAGYRSTRRDEPQVKIMQDRVAHLLPMLLLARVDGKSPVEYLAGQEEKRSLLRKFVYAHLLGKTVPLETLIDDWFAQLGTK